MAKTISSGLTNISYQKLTPEEMQSRGILGRLVGICGDYMNPTRNDRLYIEQLWDLILKDPDLLEKIKNKMCYGELGHPEDRAKVDFEKIAIALPELPKKNADGTITAVFDILNTPNGRILKTLCDYGAIPGISTRGQGEVIQDQYGNDIVDPDSYKFECWDIVIQPAVEAARLQFVNESLDSKKVSLEEELINLYKKEPVDSKPIVEDTLAQIDINVDENLKEDPRQETDKTDKVEDTKLNDDDGESTEVNAEVTPDSENLDITDPIEEPSVAIPDDENSEKINLINQKLIELISELKTKKNEELISDALNGLVDELELSDSDKELFGDLLKDESSENDEEPESSEDDNLDEALDLGSKKIMKQLQEAIQSKSIIENTSKELQEELAVSNAKVEELVEEINQYKSAIGRLSLIARDKTKLDEEVKSLKESLANKDTKILEQQNKLLRLIKSRKENLNLSEQLETKENEIKSLNESISSKEKAQKDELKLLQEQLQEQKNIVAEVESKFNGKLQKAEALTQSYKKLANQAMNLLIEERATKLGLSPNEIKRKLGSSYTINDLNEVCEELKRYQLNVSKLPFSTDNRIGIRINEGNNSLNKIKSNNKFEDGEIDDSLLRLANLK